MATDGFRHKEKKAFHISMGQVRRVLDQRGTLAMQLTFDLISREPVMKVGEAQFGPTGITRKPVHIETFVGQQAVDAVLSVLMDQYISPKNGPESA